MKDHPPAHYRAIILGLYISAAAFSARATGLPPAPSVSAMPRPGEGLEVFQQHDSTCRAYAADTSIAIAQDDKSKALGSAVVGAGLGAATGALIGSASGHAGNGAAIGAGGGLLFGALSGRRKAQEKAELIQSHYDVAYTQCMIADGEHIPGPPIHVIYAPPRIVYASPPVVYEPPSVIFASPPPTYAAYPPG
jgi:hypothetical protein